MSFQTLSSKTIQNGDGSNKNFDFSFRIPSVDSLSLTKRNSDGSETAIDSNFSVSGYGSYSGGTVIYPSSGEALAPGEQITIKRVNPLTQNKDFKNQGEYSLEDIEDGLDYIVEITQQLEEQLSRCLKIDITSSSSNLSISDFVANKILYVSSDGSNISMSNSDIGNIEQYLSSIQSISSEIATVSNIEADIVTVSALSSSVLNVENIASEITTLSNLDSEIASLGLLGSEISSLAGILSEISSVSANLTDIQNAASFNFPTLVAADSGKSLKVNSSGNGYELAELAGNLPFKPIHVSISGGDSNNDIVTSPGNFNFDDYSGSAEISTELIKKTDELWSAGTNAGSLDTGVSEDDEWYHVYAINNPTTGLSDILTSKTYYPRGVSNPNAPSGFTKKKYRFSFRTDGDGDIIKFKQDGRKVSIEVETEISFLVSNSVPTAFTVVNLEGSPDGIECEVQIRGTLNSSSDTRISLLPGNNAQSEFERTLVMVEGGGQSYGVENIYTDTSARILYKSSDSNVLFLFLTSEAWYIPEELYF